MDDKKNSSEIKASGGRPTKFSLRTSDRLGEGWWTKVAGVTLALCTAPSPRPRQGGLGGEDKFSQVLPYLPEIPHFLVLIEIDILSKKGQRGPGRKQRARGGRPREGDCSA